MPSIEPRRGTRARAAAAGAAFAVLAALAAPAAGEWVFDATAGFETNDNLPLASEERDVYSDAAFVASAGAGYRFQLADALALTLGADAGTVRQAQFTRLDHNSLGGHAALHAKLGLGLRAPWIGISGALTRLDYHHEPRDAWRASFGLAAGKRLGERFAVRVGYDFERRRSDDVVDIPGLVAAFGIHGDVWDTDAHLLSAGLVYEVSERLALVLDYGYRKGEAAATTRIGPAVFRASDAISPDPVFGTDRFGYRVEARTHIVGLAASWALTDRASVNLGIEHRRARAGGGFEYENNIVRVDLRARY